MASSALDELRKKVKGETPGAWRERQQTRAEMATSLVWCEIQLREWEYLGDSDEITIIRLRLRTRIQDLKAKLEAP
jgi:hypothetical protein